LELAIRDGHIYRESIDGQTLLFPRELRNAELTIARMSRHVAEGWKNKFQLIQISNAQLTVDYLVQQTRLSEDGGVHLTILAGDIDAARWFSMKCAHPVYDLHRWQSEELQPRSVIQRLNRSATVLGEDHRIVLLDASRLGVEAMANFLDRVPMTACLTMIGDIAERPRSGHGQPFVDLLNCDVFNSTRLRSEGAVWSNPDRAPIPPARRSGLLWRLQRSTR
jgi:hypothetical protein